MRSKPFLAIILLLIISACGTGSEDAYFNQILDDEWSRGIEENPVFASYMGDKSANQDWPDISIKR